MTSTSSSLQGLPSTGDSTSISNRMSTNKRKRPPAAPVKAEKDPLCRSMVLLDSVLQFLTRATGQSMVPLKNLLSTIPSQKLPLEHVESLLRYEVIRVHPHDMERLKREWKLSKEASDEFTIGFPGPDEERLSGSTKTAAKRRLAALKRRIKEKNKKAKTSSHDFAEEDDVAVNDWEEKSSSQAPTAKEWSLPTEIDPDYEEEPVLEREKEAHIALKEMLGLEVRSKDDSQAEGIIPVSILPKQISYAGSHPAQEAIFDEENVWHRGLDPRIVGCVQRKLYRHQAVAIESALRNIPTLVCTGTGSGKSLCFLVPVLNAALRGEKSMLLFPTKALAQDQVVKLGAWLEEHNLQHEIHAATLDGDTPHSQRVDIITSCNIILTNPDTLHVAIMPNWKHLYRPLLTKLRYVVIDEAHMYNGVFGAHVSMILARLYRLAVLQDSPICFLACSATLAHPDTHFRLLCCIHQNQSIKVVKEDGSPRGAKHFWVWNPPLLDINGKSVGAVQHQRKAASFKKGVKKQTIKSRGKGNEKSHLPAVNGKKKDDGPVDLSQSASTKEESRETVQHRRHSADETSLLLALAMSRGVRCIAFCKTRCLVEWVYERTLQALKSSPKTADLCSRVESYRGGYIKEERRKIEERLFNNQLLGVVGTSALELGVDIGGVDLTLHCGFPTSHENLIQQSGRAGRGANASTSLAICVCFNSPMDQHLWRHPSSLLSRGLSAPLSMPVYPGLVQGHLLCAGQEYPLSGALSVLSIQAPDENIPDDLIPDADLFGSAEVYKEALQTLQSQGSLVEETVPIRSGKGQATIYKTHPSMKNPWNNVSIRSIEPVSYQIVDSSHPKQNGRTDGIHDPAAVLDTIPYSRIFYHAFPGAIITHRSRRYKITCMTRPPAFGKGFRGSVSLGAFAQPCNLRYYTRPLSSLMITVVKQIERVDLSQGAESKISNTMAYQVVDADKLEPGSNFPDVASVFDSKGPELSHGSFAGCGVVTVKRNVHGYKKVSIVTREEISRSELALPDMEFDSFAFWLDCDAEVLSPQLGAVAYGHGVHALSHAFVAVAPLFVPCTVSDVCCDHSVYGPTKVTVFDARAGGSGICSQLWKSIFIPNGILEKALDLLEDCPSCSGDRGYEGGCPACLQAGECIKFNDFLSKSSGLVIGKHMLHRLQETEAYKEFVRKETTNTQGADDDAELDPSKQASKDVCSPRRMKRERAMRQAREMVSKQDKQVVVGRPCWPMDRSDGPRQVNTCD